MGIVFNIQKFCIHDGDGIRTCIFLKGCPLRCIWCHNPESIDKEPVISFNKEKCSLCLSCVAFCPARNVINGVMNIDREKCKMCGECIKACLRDANEIIGKEMTASEVMDEVIKDRIFYDTSGGGITVTGGEPSYQPEFTLELLRLSKEYGISSAVETCGTGTTEFYIKASEIGTTFLFDIKCIDPERHRELTGADNSHILNNLKYLMDFGADIIIRIPMIPGCNDSDEDISLLASFLIENKAHYRYAEIMPYHASGVYKTERIGKKTSYIHENATESEISRWRSCFELHNVSVRISE